MTAASPTVPPPVGENGLNGGVSGPMNMPRFHPIAINPNTSGPPAPPVSASYRPYGAPMPEQQHQHQQQQPPPQHLPPPPHHHVNPPPPPPPPGPPLSIPSQLEQIEARLRQIEQEEASRAAARARILAIRKREDEEFRMITERAEAEEEELRRQRKRLKRESMGLTCDSQNDSPPRPMPRRLSETNAATALAIFKQQTPPEPRPAPTPIIQQPPQIMNPNVGSGTSTSTGTSAGTGNGTGTFRKKQKYTIKNAEAWGERHGRPAAYDPAGRALWKRPSDGRLVYLDCPVPSCGKSDFVTLHGFMCHLTKKHKDRSLGSQSRALDICGTVYDPNAPRPPRPSVNRGSTEDSRSGSVHTDVEGYQQEIEYSSASDEEDGQDQSPQIKKEESGSKAPEVHSDHPNDAAPVESSPQTNGSNKPTIAAMIDSNVQPESWRSTTPPADVKGAPDQPAAANGSAESAAGSHDAGKENSG